MSGLIKTTTGAPSPAVVVPKRVAQFLMGGFILLSLAITWKKRPDTVGLFRLGNKQNVVVDPNYSVVMHSLIPEIQADMIIYEHKKTKTQIMSLVPADKSQDYTFAIKFRTKPNGNKGEAHILEHSVLDGSRKYPLKDPFNQLLRGSLQTFNNAFTQPDATMYVVASRNDQDFKNLMSVFADASLAPRVITDEGKWAFRQEGWRLEKDAFQNLQFNGVVLSEMKGIYSNPDALISIYSHQALFPNNTYRFNAGGDPAEITSLEYEELVQFYNKFYHPSNAQVFVFGPAQQCGEAMFILDEYFSQETERADLREASKIHPQQRLFLSELPTSKYPYPTQGDDQDYRFMLSWLVSDDVVDKETELKWLALDMLLMSNPTSSMQQILLNSGLGTDVLGGLDGGLRQFVYCIGMKGISSEDKIQDVFTLIMTSLTAIVHSGFTENQIQSVMNSLEFQLRDPSTYGPRGVNLMFGINMWNYDQDPRRGFAFEDALTNLKKEIEDRGSAVFTELMQEQIVGNLHRVGVELYPSDTLQDTQAKTELAKINAIRFANDGTYKALLDETSQLKQVQARDDPPSVIAMIPSLTLDQLNPQGEEYPISVQEDAFNSGVTLLTHEVASSFDIVYVDIGFELAGVNFDDMKLLPFFTELLIESGTASMSGAELAQQIGIHTGGIDASYFIADIYDFSGQATEHVIPDGNHLTTKLLFAGKSTKEQSPELFSLLHEIIINSKLDAKNLAITLLKSLISGQESAIVSSGSMIAGRRIGARYTPSGFMREISSGYSSAAVFQDILDLAQSNWPMLLSRLEGIKSAILSGHRNGIVVNLTGDPVVLATVKPVVQAFLETQLPPVSGANPFPDFKIFKHPWVSAARANMDSRYPEKDEAIVVPTEVNYVGVGGPMFPPFTQVSGSTMVMAQYLETGYLYNQLRVQNGAYGVYANFERDTGLFKIVSYRDPNFFETLDVFKYVAKSLTDDLKAAQGKLPDGLESAIIGTIGGLDGSAKQAEDIGWESLRQWLRNEPASIRQSWRQQILETNADDFKDFTARLTNWQDKTTAAVVSQSSYKQASAKGYNMTAINLVKNSSATRI